MTKADLTAGVAETDLALPPAPAGLRIGLYGGSFNPPHAAHRLVAETALRRLKLDRLWWMVSPGNPLKDHGVLRPLAERLAASRATAGPDRRILVTAFEARHGRTYTADTLEIILAKRPHASFVWVMGGDSLAGFHHWKDWPRIARTLPIAVIDRPGATLSPLYAPMARTFERQRLPEAEAAALAARSAPAWVYLHGPRLPLSSTELRDAQGGAS